MARKITPRRKRQLLYISNHCKQHGRPPTETELAHQLGKYRTLVRLDTWALLEAGLIDVWGWPVG